RPGAVLLGPENLHPQSRALAWARRHQLKRLVAGLVIEIAGAGHRRTGLERALDLTFLARRLELAQQRPILLRAQELSGLERSKVRLLGRILDLAEVTLERKFGRLVAPHFAAFAIADPDLRIDLVERLSDRDFLDRAACDQGLELLL